MKVGLFLDVDGVLTDKPINLQYAQLLGIQPKLVDWNEVMPTGTLPTTNLMRHLSHFFEKPGLRRNLRLTTFMQFNEELTPMIYYAQQLTRSWLRVDQTTTSTCLQSMRDFPHRKYYALCMSLTIQA